MKHGCFEIVSGWIEDVGCAPTRIPLQGQLELEGEFPRLAPDYGAVGVGYARICQGPGAFRIVAVGSRAFVTLNGTPVQEATLRSGDLLTWGDVTLRFLEFDEPEHREPGLEAAIAAADDEACWEVYADWLLALGDPLGERIRGLRPHDAEFLGRLRPLVTEHGVLTLEWSHGFIRSARLRSWGSIEAEQLLVWLLALPVARFLRSLEVELRSFVSRQRGPEATRLPTVLEQIQRVLKDAPLPALERLELGPLFVPVDPALTRVVRPRNAPRLPQPGPHGFLGVKSAAWLEIERGLEPGPRRELHVDERVQLQETPRVLVGSVYWNEGWNLFHASPEDRTKELRLDGRPLHSNWHALRDGDLIESGEWLRLRFRTG